MCSSARRIITAMIKKTHENLRTDILLEIKRYMRWGGANNYLQIQLFLVQFQKKSHLISNLDSACGFIKFINLGSFFSGIGLKKVELEVKIVMAIRFVCV